MVGKEEKTIVLIPTISSSGNLGPSDWGLPPLHTEELAQRDPFFHWPSKFLEWLRELFVMLSVGMIESLQSVGGG